MPMPASIGCFAIRAARRLRRRAARTASGSPMRDGTLERKVVDAPYDPAHHRFNDGRCDRQGRFFVGTMNEKRDANTGALYRLDADLLVARGVRRHDDQQRPRVEPGRTHDVPRRHADAHRARVRLRRAHRDAVGQAARSRASARKATGRTAPASTAKAATGARSTAAARSCAYRRKGGCSASFRCRRCARRCARSADRT